RGVSEHFRERHFRTDDLSCRCLLHALRQPAPAGQVAHHVAEIVLGSDYFHLHDRLQQYRARLLRTVAERHRAGDLERHFAGVDVMVGTVIDGHLRVYDRVAGDHAVFHLLTNALVDCADVLFRYHAADDRIDEFVTCTGLLGLDAQEHVAILAAAARLPDEFAFLLHRFANRFPVGNLRLADVRLDLELPLHAVDDDVEVQLAHTGNDRLAGLLIRMHAERRVLFRELLQRDTHLLLVDLRLRLDCNRNHRLRKLHLLQGDHALWIGERVAGGDILETNSRGDIARTNFLDFPPVVRMHLQQT